MRLLLAADNPGGANILSCLIGPARERGLEVMLRPSGAAARLWQAPEAEDFPAAEVLVTGTGFADTERQWWRRARERGVPSLAVIDAWNNLELRFRLDGQPCWPDAVAVPDADVAARLGALAPPEVAIAVIGQPHLEAVTARLKAARAAAPGNDRPTLAWVSEPVAEDYPNRARGFEQYEVFQALAAHLPEGIRLLVCPHPREDRARWAALAAEAGAELADRPTPALLPQMDGVIGMLTMVLIEAALAGIPALALQPGRKGPSDPIIDRLCPVVTDPAGMAPAIAAFIAGLGTAPAVPAELRAMLDGATLRLLALVERVARREFIPEGAS